MQYFLIIQVKKETPKKSWKQPAPKPPVIVQGTKKYPAPKPPANVHAFTRVPSRDPSPEKITHPSKSPKKTQNIESKSPVKERPTSGETKQLAWDQAVIKTLVI